MYRLRIFSRWVAHHGGGPVLRQKVEPRYRLREPGRTLTTVGSWTSRGQDATTAHSSSTIGARLGTFTCELTGLFCPCTRFFCPWTRFFLVGIPVLVGGAIPPAPAVPISTHISARLKCVQRHVAAANMIASQSNCFLLFHVNPCDLGCVVIHTNTRVLQPRFCLTRLPHGCDIVGTTLKPDRNTTFLILNNNRLLT